MIRELQHPPTGEVWFFQDLTTGRGRRYNVTAWVPTGRGTLSPQELGVKPGHWVDAKIDGLLARGFTEVPPT